MTDWNDYQKCPICHRAIGKPCMDLLGRYSLEGQVIAVDVELAEPHSRRKLRAAALRKEKP